MELALSVTADLSSEAAEGDNVLVSKNIIHVLLSALEAHAADCHGSLTGVLRKIFQLASHKGNNKLSMYLEVNTEVRSACPHRYDGD